MKKRLNRFLVNNYTNVLFVIIIFIASVIRFIDLDNTPHGFHADEASFLVNSVSLLETGKDEDNRFLPLTLNSLIDPKPALYAYLQIPFIALLGPTVAASRMPSAVLGISSIILVRLISMRLKQRELGLFLIFVLAISPWHIVISRSTQEVIMSFAFLVLTLLLLIEYLQNKKFKILALLFISSFLTMYSYHSAKIILPIFLTLSLPFMILKNSVLLKDALKIWLSVVAAFVLSVIVLSSSDRIADVNIFNSDVPLANIIEQTASATNHAPVWLLRLWYNKPHFFFREIFSQYISYFSGDFLFMSWAEPRRYSVPFQGLFHIIEFPILLLGIFSAIYQRRKELFYVLLMMAIAPIPAMLTIQETPSTIRTFVMILPLAYFISCGLQRIMSAPLNRFKKLSVIGLAVIYSYSTFYFFGQYAVQQKVYRPWHRNWPYTQIAQSIQYYTQNTTKVIVTSDLRPLYAYFVLSGEITPRALQQQPLARFRSVYSLDRFVFDRSHCAPSTEWEIGAVYVLESQCLSEIESINLEVLERIKYFDGLEAYVIARYQI